MATLDPFPDTPSLTPAPTATPRLSPALMMGAVSPLWGFYGAAAAGGVAYWWMTRWARPANLEALFERATPAAAAPEALVGPPAVVETAPVTPEPVVEAVDAAAALAPSAESEAEAPQDAPAATMLEAATAAPPETAAPEPRPAAEIVAEIEAAPPRTEAAVIPAAAKPRARKPGPETPPQA